MNHRNKKPLRLEIAQTILEQIKATDIWALGAWGARNLVPLEEKRLDDRTQLGGLQMTVNGRKFKGLVTVRLMPDDLYTVEFGRMVQVTPEHLKRLKLRIPEYKVTQSFSGIFCDQLMSIIDDYIER